MKLILVRHGQTEANINKIVQGGGSHGKLTQTGISQAKKTGLELKNEKIDVAYVSDLKRTQQTAKEILKFHPETKVKSLKELREKHYGDFENKTVEEYLKLKKQHENEGKIFIPKGGESEEEFKLRIEKIISELTKEKNKTILIISHGTFIRFALGSLLKKDVEKEYDKYAHKNAAFSMLELKEDNNHKIKVLNYHKHLK